jgi:hypothetical protein
MRLRIDDIEYLLRKKPFDKDLPKSERTDQWTDQCIVRKHIHELRTDSNFFNETRDSTLLNILYSMQQFYNL